jgi:hypothetical protein
MSQLKEFYNQGDLLSNQSKKLYIAKKTYLLNLNFISVFRTIFKKVFILLFNNMTALSHYS